MSRPILFRCPQTGMNVQHWLAEQPDQAEGTHTSVVCPACTKLHFIDNSIRKPLGEKK